MVFRRLLGSTLLAAAVGSVLLACALVGSSSARPAGKVNASDRTGWGQLPVAARGAVSSGLGAVERGYRVRRAPAGLVAVSGAQGLRARFGAGGVTVSSNSSWFGLRANAVGFGERLAPVRPVAPVAHANRVVYSRDGVSEWYANGPLGLEQGFTVARPGQRGSGPLTLSLTLTGNLRPSLAKGHRSLVLARGRRQVIAYRDLAASDARGRSLPAWLTLQGNRLQIRVDTRGAEFPVRIDPIVQQAKLIASDGTADDELGFSVAASSDGSTVVAGAIDVAAGNGAVYVFVKPADGWASGTETAKLTASDGAARDELGTSVAVSADGSIIAAGAAGATVGGHPDQGAVYLFAEPAGGWASGTETAKLTASDGAANDQLGQSVGLSSDGSTLVAGAPAQGGSANPDPGAAYVFVEPAGGWSSATQTAKLTASDVAANQGFGYSVGVSSDGSTIVAAAPGVALARGAVYVFARPTGGWSSATQTAKLTASDGAIGDELGYAVAVSSNGSTIVAGANNWNAEQGAVYVFAKPAGGWSSATQTAKLTASDGSSDDGLGTSVGVSGDGSVVVATAQYAPVGPNYAQGAVYVFDKPAAGWSSGTQTAKLTAADGASLDELGSTAVSSDASTIVGGATGATLDGNFAQGAVYVFGQPASPVVSATAPASATVGSAISASAIGGSLSGGSAPSGAMTFEVFGPQSSAPTDCSGGGTSLATIDVSGDGSYDPGTAFTPTTAGDYWWYASYGGDATNDPAGSPCGASMAETVVGQASPVLAVSAPSSGTAGSAIATSAITASLTGGFSPTGTVTFKLFGPESSAPADCRGGTTVGTATVSDDGAYDPNAGFTPTAAGDYWWYASYDGDTNNNPADTACAASMAETIVAPAPTPPLAPAGSPTPAGTSSSTATPGSTGTSASVGISSPAPPVATITHPVRPAAPRVSRLRLHPDRFMAPTSDSAIVDTTDTGTTISYRDTLAGQASLQVMRCVGAGGSCRRLALAGKLTEHARKGLNRLWFSGWLHGRALRPGRYVLELTTTTAARHSGTAAAPFSILAPPPTCFDPDHDGDCDAPGS